MEIYDHTPTARGRVFLWGGVALGLLLIALLLTRGFGLFSEPVAPAETPQLVHRGQQIFIPESSPLRQRLTVSPAASQPVSGELIAPGLVESDPAHTAALLPALGGRVRELKVALGDRVAAGQILALIDSPDLAQAYDDNDKAADALQLTSKNLTRQQGQQAIGAASERDVDQAKSDQAQAAAEYARTQARLRAIGMSPEPAQRTRLLPVRAPFSGSITALNVASGNMINDPTQPIMTIADLSTVWVTTFIAEKDIGRVSVGNQAQLTFDAYPNQKLTGKVLFVSDVMESDSRRIKARIALPNPHYAFKPNMFAIVMLSGPPRSRIVLPTSALLMNNDRTTVFVATAPWTFERRTVVPELEEGSVVTIRSGINAGEQVVVRGGILLND